MFKINDIKPSDIIVNKDGDIGFISLYDNEKIISYIDINGWDEIGDGDLGYIKEVYRPKHATSTTNFLRNRSFNRNDYDLIYDNDCVEMTIEEIQKILGVEKLKIIK